MGRIIFRLIHFFNILPTFLDKSNSSLAGNWSIQRRLGHEMCNGKYYVCNCGLAPPKGLEPLTDWLTASRSTWLSYGGTSECAYALSVQQRLFKLSYSMETLDFLHSLALSHPREKLVRSLQCWTVPLTCKRHIHEVVHPTEIVFRT